MIYKNIDIHNVGELIPCENGGVKWIRVPQNVHDNLSTNIGKLVSIGSTGVELRFVIKSGNSATLKLELTSDTSVRAGLQVFYGGIQGDSAQCESYNCSTPGVYSFEIKKASNIERLQKISNEFNIDWSPEVIRVIFDRGRYRLIDIEGDVAPPAKEQLPEKTLLTYGSSITHGSVSIDAPHTWASYLAHSLNMDLRNLGMAGSCAMEPKFAEYIANEGEMGNWDIATLELGINVLNWNIEKIHDRAGNLIKQVATRNPDKKIYVISPFYCEDDYENLGEAEKWRTELKKILDKANYPNVTYIDGSRILDNMSLLASGGVHPNVYGVSQIAERLYKIIGV